MSTTISGALDIELTTPAGRTLHAALCGEGNRLDLVVDEPRAFAGPPAAEGPQPFLVRSRAVSTDLAAALVPDAGRPAPRFDVDLLAFGRSLFDGDGGGRFTEPAVTWSTSEASPSGVAVAAGSLWVAALRGERLWQVPLDGEGGAGTPVARLSGEFGRLRAAETAPDGSLWLLTSNRDGRGAPTGDDDRVLRLTPS